MWEGRVQNRLHPEHTVALAADLGVWSLAGAEGRAPSQPPWEEGTIGQLTENKASCPVSEDSLLSREPSRGTAMASAMHT